MRWSGCRQVAGGGLVVFAAGGDSRVPAGAVDHDGVDPAQQRGGARHAGLSAAAPGSLGGRAGVPGPLGAVVGGAGRGLAWPAAVTARYFAAMTGLWCPT